MHRHEKPTLVLLPGRESGTDNNSLNHVVMRDMLATADVVMHEQFSSHDHDVVDFRRSGPPPAPLGITIDSDEVAAAALARHSDRRLKAIQR